MMTTPKRSLFNNGSLEADVDPGPINISAASRIQPDITENATDVEEDDLEGMEMGHSDVHPVPTDEEQPNETQDTEEAPEDIMAAPKTNSNKVVPYTFQEAKDRMSPLTMSATKTNNGKVVPYTYQEAQDRMSSLPIKHQADDILISILDKELPIPPNLSEPLTTFTCFRKLPAELRIKIWKLTFPGPRMVKVALRIPNGRKHEKQEWRHVSRCAPPVALFVNQESRIEAQKEYELAFPFCWTALFRQMVLPHHPLSSCQAIRKYTVNSQPGHTGRTYFNFALDTVIFSFMTTVKGLEEAVEGYDYLPAVGLEKVRKIMVPERGTLGRRRFNDPIVGKFLAGFDGEVFVVYLCPCWIPGGIDLEFRDERYTVSMIEADDDTTRYDSFRDFHPLVVGRHNVDTVRRDILQWREEFGNEVPAPADASKPTLTSLLPAVKGRTGSYAVYPHAHSPYQPHLQQRPLGWFGRLRARCRSLFSSG